MKKILCLVLSVVMLFSAVSALAYTDYRSLPEGSDAEYIPYAESGNVTRYTPWYKAYHMQTAAEAANGVRGGEGGQVITCFGVSPVNPDYVMFGVDTSGAWRSTDGGENWYQLREGSNTWAVTDIQWHPKYERVVYMAQASTTGTDSGSVDKAKRTNQDGIWRSRDAGITWEQVISANTISTTQTDILICFDNNNCVYALTSDGLFKSVNDGDDFSCISKLVYTTDETKPFFTSSYNNSDYTILPDKFVGSLYVSPDGKTIVTATYGGVFISRDGGVTWVKANASVEMGTGYSIAVNPLDSNHWIIVTSGGDKVYKSFDAGVTWQKMSFYKYNNGKYFPVIVKFSPPKNGKTNIHIVFHNMTNPYTYSTDMGATWKKTVITPNDRFTTHYGGYFSEGFEFCDSNPDIVYFSFGDIAYKSTNGGQSFEISCSGFSGNYVKQFYFDKDNRIWFAFTDKGLAVTDTPYDGKTLPTAHMAGVTGTSASVLIDPNNPNHIFSNSGGWSDQQMKVSFDGAKTWSNIEGTDSTISWTFLQYDLEDKNIIYSPRYTSYDNGVTWEANEYTYMAISKVDDDVRFASRTDGGKGFMYTTDGGENWTTVTTSSGVSTICPDVFDKNKFYAGHAAGWIMLCTINDDGTLTHYTKKEVHGIVGTEDNEMKAMINVIAQNPNDSKHLVAGVKCTNSGVSSHGIIESRDGGESWYAVPGARGPMTIYELAFSPVSNEVFIGNCSGGITVYEYDNYSDKNEICFDVNPEIAESVEPVTGKYGSKYTVVAPKVTNKDYEFIGYEYSAEEFIGEGETKFVKKFYNVGDEVMFSYKDITLTAKFRRTKNAPNFTVDNETYIETKSTIDEMAVVGSTWYKNYNDQKDGNLYLNTNRSDYVTSEVYYSIDIGGGNEVTSAKLKIDAEKVADEGTLKIYGYSKSFDETFAEFTTEKTVKSFAVGGGTLIGQASVTESADLEIDITEFVRKQVKAGKKTALVKITYKTVNPVSTANKDGFVLLSRLWNKNAVQSVVTYESSNVLPTLSSDCFNVIATLPMGREKVTPIVAVYDKANPFKLVKFETKEAVQLETTREIFYKTDVDVSDIDISKHIVKFFMISDFGTLKPVTANVTIQ